MPGIGLDNVIDVAIGDRATTQSTKIIESFLDRNQLHQYASYTTIFTLSALREEEIRNPEQFLQDKPHDIIARTAGIGNPNTNDRNAQGEQDPTTTSVSLLLNDREKSSIARAQSILNSGRDIYFETVNIESVHGFNPERRTAAVGKIKIKLSEPSGVTILERLKAAAFNCKYKDHIDAPFLLTIQFRGFDTKGAAITLDPVTSKRFIPIKIVRMGIAINAGGAMYELDCVPYNEAGFMNRYAFTRSTIELKDAESLGSFLKHFNNQLNKQTEQEADKGSFTKGMQDKYFLFVDPLFADRPLKVDGKGKNLNSVELIDYQDPDSKGFNDAITSKNFSFSSRAGSINPGTSILKVLEEAMTSLQPVQDVLKQWFFRSVEAIRTNTGKQTITNVDIAAMDDSAFYVDWFRIKSSVNTNTEQYDNITKQHPKTITYYIEPYKMHVFRLVKPGISLGGQKNVMVKKIYDYIFTGKNIDILDLDINYKVAYYQTKLAPQNPYKKNEMVADSDQLEAVFGIQEQIEELLPIRQAPAGIRSAPAGIFGAEDKQDVDLFMDALTNPQADMVKISMKIMGDPAWIGVSQFLNVKTDINTNSAIAENKNTDQFAGSNGWNDKFRCYSTDVTDPIVRLNFRMPTDLNNTTGLYELGRTESATFSGLYQVYKVDSNFDRGTFTQTLHMTRFNNQSDSKKNRTAKVRYYVSPDQRIITAADTSTEGSF